MSYRRALHPPRAGWGVFLDQQRREHDWSAVQAHENLHGVLKLSIKSVAVYKAIEQGTRSVSPEEDEALRAYFGKGPEEGGAEPVEEASLATAIADLVVELRLWRTEDRVEIAALRRAVVALGGSLPPAPEAEASPEQPVRRRTAG